MKSNITSYHKKNRHATLRDKRPVPELKFPIDAVFREREKQERAALRAAEAEEQKRAVEERRRQREEGIE